MLAVPISIGRPEACVFFTSWITALYFDFSVLNTKSVKSFLIFSLLVGMLMTSIPYIFNNSSASVVAVPVMPDNFVYILK